MNRDDRRQNSFLFPIENKGKQTSASSPDRTVSDLSSRAVEGLESARDALIDKLHRSGFRIHND